MPALAFKIRAYRKNVQTCPFGGVCPLEVSMSSSEFGFFSAGEQLREHRQILVATTTAGIGDSCFLPEILPAVITLRVSLPTPLCWCKVNCSPLLVFCLLKSVMDMKPAYSLPSLTSSFQQAETWWLNDKSVFRSLMPTSLPLHGRHH